ncbi:outer membrane beta-barrel protein [Niabella aurantiaca]|uniref:outer membrane beta-barrel protein n=1 Tax=Niabella aurantiaca TaxID=379900 RepID=UPI00035EE8D8|nr:outer membrane beta-barrel protein [Niabella aurantiaca]
MKTKRTLLLTFMMVWAAVAGAQDKPDTLVINGITIIRDNKPVEQEPKKSFFKSIHTRRKPKSIVTEWGMVDIGMSNFVDGTQYGEDAAAAYAPGSNEQWFATKAFKSRNINIWLVTQRYNLVRHFVNLQYGLGLELNNYRFKNPVRFNPRPPTDISNPPVASMDATPGREYRKNKLAADYITVPLMLNFNLTPDRLYPFEISAGVSVGYLYAARNKTITSDEGKQKAKGDFDLDPWKLSYVGDLTLGVVTLYGSYAFRSMYSRGLDHTPYNFGIRLRPADFFGKIQN